VTPTLVLTHPHRFALEQRPPVEPLPGQVAVEIEAVGLCGTDLHIVEGSHPRARFPLALGHELVGRPVGGALDGRLVVIDPLIACGSCAACSIGEAHVCARLRLVGIDCDGGLAGRVLVGSDRLHPVPAGLDPILAVLAEPLAVAVHAIGRARIAPGERVVIMGAGPIGLLIALAARTAGASRILVGERSAGRRAFAAELGFEVLDADDPVEDLGRRTDGWMADAAFDAAAAPAVAAILPRLVRPAGRIGLVGTYGRPVELDLQAVLFAELTLLGNRVYRPADIDAALALLAADREAYRPLITEVVRLDETPRAFERLRDGDGVKYVVRLVGQ
jgi:2-desacetyl-2-hydroxyethyl bacteriochlorophyllide A dehydrogenase